MDWLSSSFPDLAGGYSHSCMHLVLGWVGWLLCMWWFIFTNARLILTWLWQCLRPGRRPNRNACTCAPSDRYKNIYVALFLKNKKLSTQVSVSSRRIHKLPCIYIMEIYITKQMKELELYTGEISYTHYWAKAADTKESTLCMIPWI